MSKYAYRLKYTWKQKACVYAGKIIKMVYPFPAAAELLCHRLQDRHPAGGGAQGAGEEPQESTIHAGQPIIVFTSCRSHHHRFQLNAGQPIIRSHFIQVSSSSDFKSLRPVHYYCSSHFM